MANGQSGITVVTHELDSRLSALDINQERLVRHIHEGCEFGKAHKYGSGPTETGMARLALNDADKDIRCCFLEQAESIGRKTFVDQMGNLFAIRTGRHTAAPPIMMGLTSGHTAYWWSTASNIGVVNWTNEEGAKFPMMAVASGVWAEAVPLETAWNLAEVSSSEGGKKRTMKDELERIGFVDSTRASYKRERRKVGIVQGVQAFKWFEITVKGRDTHAGTTPFNARSDPTLCAAKLIVQSNAIGKALQGFATTGIILTIPGSINTMAHTVSFPLDIRHTSNHRLAEIEDRCRTYFARIASQESECGCEVVWQDLVDSPAVTFHEDCVEAVRSTDEEVVKRLPMTAEDGKMWKNMISGAGHDSCYTNQRCPTSMIFVPTREGISHKPQEYCSPEDCAIGAQVLLGAVLRYDALRTSNDDFGNS